MRPMVPALFTALIPVGLFLLGLAAPRSAPATTIDLSWNACSPIQAVIPNAFPGPVSLFVSAIGQDELHFGYQFRFALSGQFGQVRDAWRFDAVGCQTPYFLQVDTHPNAVVAKTCPAFAGPFTTTQQWSYQYELPETGVPGDMLSGFLSHTYEARSGPRDPAQRYFLGRFVFDHTFSVSGVTSPGIDCGGFEEPVCIELMPAHCSWRNLLGQPVAFNVGNGAVGFLESCTPLPAAPSTWGAIKVQYRR